MCNRKYCNLAFHITHAIVNHALDALTSYCHSLMIINVRFAYLSRLFPAGSQVTSVDDHPPSDDSSVLIGQFQVRISIP